MKYPLINECINCLKRNTVIKKIVFLEKSPQKAFSLAGTLEKSYAIKSEAKDFKSLKQKKLETSGVDVWYAPRDIVKDDYATAIVIGFALKQGKDMR